MKPIELPGYKAWEYQYAADDASYHWLFSNSITPQNNADLPPGYGVMIAPGMCGYLIVHLPTNKCIRIDDAVFTQLQSDRRLELNPKGMLK